MNFRKLLTYLTVGTAAVIPYAGAQNPTILQGSYISNVFGNSNFVLNPNAQTNVANVTVSGGGSPTATVTRSTTTPLVATSEFNVAITSANGTATWALRAFDAGMKNNNCEARFSYRGFAATSKVQILQSTNVVASLTLTPATDPRIASINFPCGDLSTATTFVVTDTAILAGTNEIGGIYVGLATNMANVAQAEFVGATELASCTSAHTVTSTTFANLSSPTCTRNNFGAATTATNDFSVTIPNAKPGWYFVKWNGIPYVDAGTNNSCYWALKEDTQGYIGGGTYAQSPTGLASAIGASQLTMDLNTTTTATRTFRVVGKSATGTCKVDAGSAINSTVLSVFRFPSSSELVVTPERQNWYVNAYQGENASYPTLGLTTVASVTEITASGGTMNPESGSQPVATLCQNGTSPATLSTSTTNCGATNESLGIAFAIPTPGQYEVCAEFTHAPNQTAGGSADVYFQLAETNLNNTTVLQSYTSANNGAQANSSVFAFQSNINMCRIFSFSSVGTKGVRLLYKQTITGTITGNVIAIDTNLNRALRWKIQPVTNQSNSALYVEGPVKASATGAAIPEGYVNEFATREITDTSLRQQLTPTVATWYYPWTGELTLPAGNWNLCYSVVAQHGQTGSTSYADIQTRIQNKTDDTTVILDFHSPAGTPGNITGSIRQSASCKPIAITSSKTFRVGIKYTNGSGTPTVSDLYLRGDLNTSRLYGIRLN